MAERAILAALSGLMRGLNEGLEVKRTREVEDKKLLMAEEEMELKQLDRIESRKMRLAINDQNASYREAALAQTGANNREKNAIDRARLDKSGGGEGGKEALRLRATDSVAKLLKDRRELQEDLATFEDLSKRKPEKYTSQLERVRLQVAEMDEAISKQQGVLAELEAKDGVRPQATARPTKAPGELTQMVSAIGSEADPARAKKILEAAKAKGYLKPGTESFKALMDAYTSKF